MNNRLAAICMIAGVLYAPAIAHARLNLHLPVDCVIGETCFIQNYMDHNPAEDASHDYTCGSLTYDGHNGTDFRVSTYADLDKGIDVLAAAAGEIHYLRVQPEIEESDIPLLQLIKLGMRSDCGSSIRIRHATGWESIYCHLDPAGFAVKQGDKVVAGQVIGRMGTSGTTQFPHVHYELRHYSTPVDPFVGYAGPYDCAPDKRYRQWDEEFREPLAYVASGVVTAGFGNAMLHARDVRQGTAFSARLDGAAPAIHFGVEIYGIRQHDVLTIRLFAPDGALLAENKRVYDAPYALTFETVSAGLEEGKHAWPVGIYSAKATLERFEKVIKETVIDRNWQASVINK